MTNGHIEEKELRYRRPKFYQLSIPVTVHCLGDVLSTLTSEPAKPPFAPLSIKKPCLDWSFLEQHDK